MTVGPVARRLHLLLFGLPGWLEIGRLWAKDGFMAGGDAGPYLLAFQSWLCELRSGSPAYLNAQDYEDCIAEGRW